MERVHVEVCPERPTTKKARVNVMKDKGCQGGWDEYQFQQNKK